MRKTISYNQLVEGIKGSPLLFLRSLIFRGQVQFTDTDWNQLPRRTIIATAILCLGNWKVVFSSEYSEKHITILYLPFLIFALLYEVITNPLLIIKHRTVVKKLLSHQKEPQRISNHNNSVLYLRTDLLGQTREGGSYTHVAGVIEGLQAKGMKVTLVSSGEFPTKANEVITIPYPDRISASMDTGEIAYSFHLFNALRKLPKPSCIYQRHSGFNLTGLLLAHHWNIPLLLEVNNLEVWIRKNWGTIRNEALLRETEHLLLSQAEKSIVVSDVLKDDLISFGAPADRILVNPNGVSPAVFTPNPEGYQELRSALGYTKDNAVVGFLGSFGVWHGVPILVEAIPLIHAQNASVRFLLIGDGELKKESEKTLSALIKKGVVTFTGRIPHKEAPKYLAACDILASPHVQNADGTRFFGSPTKLFEYMATERVIVASNLEQIGEILTNNETAILVEPGNPHQLAKGILSAASNKKLSKEIGKSARLLVMRQYTWEQNARKAIASVT